jgi:hypothetical protein
MSATTKAAIATFAGVGLIFAGALFTAGSAMAAGGQQALIGQNGGLNMCAIGGTCNSSTGGSGCSD